MFYHCNTTDSGDDWMDEPVTIEDFSKRFEHVRASIKRLNERKKNRSDSK